MIWAEFVQDKNFTNLVYSIHEAVNKIFPVKLDYKEPIPHATLARIKFVEKIILHPLPEMQFFPDLAVNNVNIYESETSTKGAEYSVLSPFHLR